MDPLTPRQIEASLKIAGAIAGAIRSLGTVPNGHLWARLDGKISFSTYTSILDTLKRAKLVAEDNNVLRWIGPKESK